MNHPASMCTVDVGRCTLCGLCVVACPCHSAEMGEHGPVFHCTDACAKEPTPGCSVCMCEEVCPTGVLTCRVQIVASEE
jgi:Fe-S-cluster-containing hydrogenase component 2